MVPSNRSISKCLRRPRTVLYFVVLTREPIVKQRGTADANNDQRKWYKSEKKKKKLKICTVNIVRDSRVNSQLKLSKTCRFASSYDLVHIIK